MTESEQNKNTVRAYVEAFNRGDLDALKRLFTPDAMIQGVLGKAPIEEALGIWRELHESYGIESSLGAVVAEGNQVAARYTERGTFRKAFRGAQPTGKATA